MRKTVNRNKNKRVLKVYLVLLYYKNYCQIMNIYFTKKAASSSMTRIKQKLLNDREHSVHIIKKSIKDSYPLQKLLRYFHTDVLDELFEN